MRIAVIGGGPGGLYFAILMKKWQPAADITVFERNRPDDTFGFGVVFSDATLDIFERYDAESYRAITENFAYWDDIEVRFKDTVHRIGGNGFCGCSRQTLLILLQNRARQLGVEMKFQTEIDPSPETFGAYDLVVAADGINSRIREANRDHFQPEVDLRPNKFTWMGSTRELDAFTFFFRETAFGIFIAHTYQYEAGRSTWVIETDPDTFARAGLDRMDEEQSARFLEGVFAEELAGHPLITNRSLWRQFPMIRSKRWVKDNVVLMGDAKGTAHFSIGAGTKLAMEDSIALFDAFRAKGTVAEALASYETDRREEVERTQHAADVSLVWFEHVDRFWDMDPRQFAFGLMTRSKAITYENLKLRAPDFVAETDRMFAEGVPGADLVRPRPPLFQPLTLRGMTVANRAVVSPMCMYSAVEGMPTDWHVVHYGARAIGGAGLVYTEMVCVAPDARITPGCAGLWSDEQEAAWTRIVDFAHPIRRRSSACSSAMPAARAPPSYVGGHGPSADGGRLADRLRLPPALLSRQPGAGGAGRGRHGPHHRRVRRGDGTCRALRLRHAGAALRPRLPARLLPVAADQPADRRLWRQPRQPPALPAPRLRGDARGLAGGEAHVGAHLRHRLGRGRHHRGRGHRDCPRLRRGRRRPRRRLHRPDHAEEPAGLWPHVPDALLPTPSATRLR